MRPPGRADFAANQDHDDAIWIERPLSGCFDGVGAEIGAGCKVADLPERIVRALPLRLSGEGPGDGWARQPAAVGADLAQARRAGPA